MNREQAIKYLEDYSFRRYGVRRASAIDDRGNVVPLEIMAELDVIKLAHKVYRDNEERYVRKQTKH